MQELDTFLNWCDQMYSNTPHCQCGAACTNGNYCSGLQTDCYKCIKRVHFYGNSTIHYNCKKMLYYYVLKHGYRFGAEVFYEMQRTQNEFNAWNDIYITSIGCGPCTEMFGSLCFWRLIGKQDVNYHFRGFDAEALWSNIMMQACSTIPTADVHSYLQDVFDYYEQSPERIDVLFFNYMLSDMKKFHETQYNTFLFNLVDLIKQKQPKLLLINDIYLKKSLEASNELLAFLTHSSIQYTCEKAQYSSPNLLCIGMYGNTLPRQQFTMTDQSIVNKYDPFSKVNSIQTIIKFV